MILTPEGKPAGTKDRTMLLSEWSAKLKEERMADTKELEKKADEKKSAPRSMIEAGMGRPTFPVSSDLTKSAVAYYTSIHAKSQAARELIEANDEEIPREIRNQIAKSNSAIGYGHPKGKLESRQRLATALTRWYGTKIEPENILSTVGGAGSLSTIFTTINEKTKNGYIVTPYPYYGLYTGPQGKNKLYKIDVMDLPGYRLTAEALEKTLQSATIDAARNNTSVGAFLLCDPNNPLGVALNETELKGIAEVLRRYDDLLIIVDEAYAEMRFDNPNLSLLKVAPDLKNRMILLRSGTKGLSAAGLRLAVTICFDELLMNKLGANNTGSVGLAPIDAVEHYAAAIEKLDKHELNKLKNYYQPQVNYVIDRLQKMGAQMPDPNYKVDGTFYVMADFSDLLGMPIPDEAGRRALNKKGLAMTDEDVCYSLLFRDNVMVGPLSYSGLSSFRGYMRITCSGGDDDLKELMDRIEPRLCEARMLKQQQIQNDLKGVLSRVSKLNPVKEKEFKDRINILLGQEKNVASPALHLKTSNFGLKNILFDARVFLAQNATAAEKKALTKIQALYRGNRDRKYAKQVKLESDEKVQNALKTLLSLKVSERIRFQNALKKTDEKSVQTSPSHRVKSYK